MRRLESLLANINSHRWLTSIVGIVGAGLTLSACNIPAFGAYHGSTLQGHDTFKLWQGFMIIALIVGVIVWGLILWSSFRYRIKPSKSRPNNPDSSDSRDSENSLPRQFQYHLPLEILYTVLPILIVAVMFYFTVVTENEVDAVSANPAVRIYLTAFQWGWRFNYTGEGVSVVGNYNHYPQAVLPVGETVQITLVSSDVVHGFYVPAFNFSRYAQPGVTNVFDLNIRKQGIYNGRCTEFCGLYHTEMIFSIKAVSPTVYHAWLSKQQSKTRTKS